MNPASSLSFDFGKNAPLHYDPEQVRLFRKWEDLRNKIGVEVLHGYRRPRVRLRKGRHAKPGWVIAGGPFGTKRRAFKHARSLRNGKKWKLVVYGKGRTWWVAKVPEVSPMRNRTSGAKRR